MRLHRLGIIRGAMLSARIWHMVLCFFLKAREGLWKSEDSNQFAMEKAN